jgi:hypothetical protein
VPVGTVVSTGPTPGVVDKSLKRIAGYYVIWGTDDLSVAQQWEQNRIVQAAYYAIGK